MNSIHIVSIFCFALCIFLFFYLKWYIKKRTTSSGLDEHRTEIVKLIAEINMVTDRDLQLIEDRVVKLKSFLEEVDKRLTLMDKDLVSHPPPKTNTEASLYTNLGRGIRSALKTPAEPVPIASPVSLQTEHPFNSRQLSLALHSSSSQMNTVSEPVKEIPQVTEIPVNKPPSKKQIRAHIDTLANEGLSAQEIASRLQISVAEVNLAMNLRRGK